MEQATPGWSAFNGLLARHDVIRPSVIRYLPVIPERETERERKREREREIDLHEKRLKCMRAYGVSMAIQRKLRGSKKSTLDTFADKFLAYPPHRLAIDPIAVVKLMLAKNCNDFFQNRFRLLDCLRVLENGI